MKHQFKVGDLAVIIGCKKDPQDIGKVVELVKRMFVGPILIDGILCWSECDGWLCASENVVHVLGIPGVVHVSEKHLMPLRGDPEPEQQKQAELTQ